MKKSPYIFRKLSSFWYFFTSAEYSLGILLYLHFVSKYSPKCRDVCYSDNCVTTAPWNEMLITWWKKQQSPNQKRDNLKQKSYWKSVSFFNILLSHRENSHNSTHAHPSSAPTHYNFSPRTHAVALFPTVRRHTKHQIFNFLSIM